MQSEKRRPSREFWGMYLLRRLAYKEDPENYPKWTACEGVMSMLHNGQIKKYWYTPQYLWVGCC